MIHPKVHELSEPVKLNLIGLALMQARMRETHRAVKHYRSRIEAEKPGVARLAADAAFVRRLIRQHNRRSARASA